MSAAPVAVGDDCPNGCEIDLVLSPVENCSCHIAAPCGACMSQTLTCPECGWTELPPRAVPAEPWRHIGGGISERVAIRPSADLGDGKRLFDYDYNSCSGSTMVYRGRYEGPVTGADIIAYFGDGTFGHRGPTLANGAFTYTKITD